MNTVKLTAPALLLAALASLSPAVNAAGASAKAASPTPDAEPDQIVVEDEWLYPLRLESVEALDEANFHFRRNEEKAAAGEIRQAISWLEYASQHALPTTAKKLTTAQTELRTLADDLSTGKVVGAARMGDALARASQGLAEWHFYRAREQYGKNDALRASQDLEAAAAHLQRAANSAHHQYGHDTIMVFDDIVEDGRLVEEGRTISKDRLTMHLDAIGDAVEEMANALG